jgi:hypothetical protein
VLVAGVSGIGANIRTLSTNGAGALLPAGVVFTPTDGRSNTTTFLQIEDAGSTTVPGTFFSYPYVFNGSSWDRQFNCSNQVFVNLSASGNAQVIAASGSTNILICHIHLSTTAAETIQLTTGTGSNCGTGNAVIDAYQSVSAIAMDFQPTAALRAGTSNALCINPSASTTLTGVIIYAQF